MLFINILRKHRAFGLVSCCLGFLSYYLRLMLIEFEMYLCLSFRVFGALGEFGEG